MEPIVEKGPLLLVKGSAFRKELRDLVLPEVPMSKNLAHLIAITVADHGDEFPRLKCFVPKQDFRGAGSHRCIEHDNREVRSTWHHGRPLVLDELELRVRTNRSHIRADFHVHHRLTACFAVLDGLYIYTRCAGYFVRSSPLPSTYAAARGEGKPRPQKDSATPCSRHGSIERDHHRGRITILEILLAGLLKQTRIERLEFRACFFGQWKVKRSVRRVILHGVHGALSLLVRVIR